MLVLVVTILFAALCALIIMEMGLTIKRCRSYSEQADMQARGFQAYVKDVERRRINRKTYSVSITPNGEME